MPIYQSQSTWTDAKARHLSAHNHQSKFWF